MVNISLLKQPCGISCGNTVIKMILNYLNIHKDISIQKIIKICGTTPQFGTRDIEMKHGLDYFGIENYQNKTVGNDEEQIAYLDNILDELNVFALRSLTQGIKHWVLVIGHNNGFYTVNDPWLGKINYTKKSY